MQNMIPRDALITKNYVLAHRKMNFKDRNFRPEIEVNKFFFKFENRIG